MADTDIRTAAKKRNGGDKCWISGRETVSVCRGPKHQNYLVDGGSSDVKEIGKYRIEPFLKIPGHCTT